MEKQNDYFLNLLNNPTFNANDFTQVGLSIDNTSIQDKNTYLKSNYIKNLDIFKTNGEFDESKFNNFYDYAKLGFQDLAKIKESDDLGNTWMAYRNDISMPETLRDNRPQFKIGKVANPLRQQSGFVNFDLKENPTMSIREIAQTQQVYDPETGKWKEAPNDTWFDNFLNPKVLATWDEDGEHEDPITGEIVKHKKGDRILNKNGTYYYENLGNRSVYGKEVLSGFDTLTTDGSFWNKLDFLDSDDIEKSTGGSLMRAAAQIIPAFIPGVGQWYIGARVGLGLSQVLPAVGKTLESLSGLDFGSSIFNKLEAWDKALTFSQSDYVQGSQTDDGQILSDSHVWSMETGLKLIADVFTQLAEQRWMFEKTSSLFSGLKKEVISSKEAQTKWIEDYIAKNTKAENIDKVLMEGISKGIDPRLQLSTMQNVNWLRAQKVLEGKLKGAQELGSKVSLAYMTGITTASAYGEAKEAGATDFEAALFTLGYTFGEWKLLNSELGQWILPELKSEKRHIKNVVQRLMPKIKEATNNSNTTSELGKLKWYQKLFNLGKDAYENNLGKEIASETLGSTISNMASEALEETSEELLLDVSKTLFNAASDLVGSGAKFEDAFENIFDRYTLSFLGGAVGGGIAGYLPAYRSARFDRSMSQQAATKELVDIIQQGKDKELLETAFKMNLGNKYLDESGNQVQNETQSQDYAVKQNFNRLVGDIKDILTVNGANLSKDSLLKELGTQDIRYGMLASLAAEESNSISWYLNRYNDLSSQLVAKSLELKKLIESPEKTDKEKREEKQEENTTTTNKKELLEKEIKDIKSELDKFKDGTMSDEFIQDALFEMTSKISGVYVPTRLDRWIEEVKGKNIEELSDSERKQLAKEFEDTKPLKRDLIRMARKVHIKNMEWLSKMITDYDETYFKNKDELTKNLEEILSIQRNNLDPNNIVPAMEQYLTIYGDEINPLLYNLQQAILASMDQEKAKPLIDKIQQIVDKKTNLEDLLGFKIPTTVDELRGLSKDQKAKLLSELEQDVDPEYIDDDIEEYIGKEIDNETQEEKETLELLNTAIKKQNIKNKIDRATEFNKQLIVFLSDQNVKEGIINKLKSAKYILPPVKQALIDFFTSSITAKIVDIDGTESELQMRQKDIDDYIKAIEDIPSSPVDIYINNVTKTLKSKGISVSPLVSDIGALISKLAKAKNLQSFSYDDKTEKLINEALQIIEIAKVGLESAATVIRGDLSDAFGFNASINEIRAKRGNKATPLATIPADVAEGIKLDIEKYEKELRMFKAIQAYNSNSILNEHDKTYKIESKLLYTRLKDFVGHLELPDWNDLDKLKKEINDPELNEFFEGIEDEPVTQEFKDKLTKIRLRIDKAVYSFFKANNEKFRGFKTEDDRENAIKEIQKLLKDVKVQYSNEKDVNTVINLQEKSIPDKDFLWYLASIAAADPEQVLFEYQSVISEQFAPIIGQEEAIRTSLSFLIDPKVFNLFADAHNANILEESPLEKGKFDSRPYRVVNAYRSIFIEGVPGSGKSSATLKTLIDILKKYHSDVLNKIVVVSNSKSNSRTLVENLGFDPENTQHFGIEEFRSKIMNGYKQFDENEDGSLKLTETDVEYDPKRHSYKYRNFTLNADGIDASFVIIDEATSLSQMDTYMLDDFMSAKDIYGVYAGDFDQLGISGSFKTKNSEGKDAFGLITQDITNYISTHKLGQVIRGNNSYKSENTIKFKLAKYDFISGLKREENRKDPINFSYYSDESGVYGDVVAKADRKDGKAIVDDGTKTIIENMINSLNEGEKINYIFDSTESELYKYLHENYADKINEISARAAQSQEGQYYIVDIAVHDNLVNSKMTSDEVKGIIEGTNYFKSLYTAMSRAKQATLIYDRGSNAECISKRLNSVRIDKLIKSNIGLDARKRYVESRKSSIKNALEIEESKLDLKWKKESFEPENPSTPSVDEPSTSSNDDTTEEETFDDKVDNENEPERITIDNNDDEKLNMMIHTFNANESGGNIDENTGELVLGDRGSRLDPKTGKIVGERIDNANGLVKLKQLGISVDQDGRISAQDTEKVLNILHKIRVAGCYGKTNKEVVSLVKSALKLGSGSNVSVNFIYKNSQSEREKVPRGALSKFFKSVKEALMYLFNKETDPIKKQKQEINHLRTIGLEIFVDGQQIEIPIGTLTSPATLVETAGFQQLKIIFDQENRNLIKFHQRLKQEKASGNKIPHLDSMLKLLQIYQWNYDGHASKHQNFVIRLNKDFVLNSKNAKLTGVQTPPKKRGESYVDQDYLYEGKRVSIEEYKRKFPSRKISAIYENITKEENGFGDIKDANGNIVIKKGLPFILVSDFYSPQVSDEDLYKEYIKQISDPNSEPRITRVYVYLPTESIDYFLFNQQEAMKKDESQRASDLDTAIGNKLTTYRLLSFMLQKDSNFSNAFRKWINEGNFSEGQKKHSLRRFERMQELLKYLTEYEKTLVPSDTLGSVSKQILNFLEQSVDDISHNPDHSEIRDILYGSNEEGLIGNTKFSIRTILLQEFRKLLFSIAAYEEDLDPDQPGQKPHSASLSGQNFYITRNGDEYIYKDYQKERIEALKKDAEVNNWTGVMFHSSLEKDSEIVTNVNSNSYKIAKINAQAGLYISSKEIEVNGKLDTTAIILNIEPVLDDILSKLVVTKDGSVCSEEASKYSQNKREQLYEENTGGFLSGKDRTITEVNHFERVFNECLNRISPDSDDIENIKEELKKYLNDQALDESSISPTILAEFANKISGFAALVVGGKKIKFVNIENSIILTASENEVYYFNNDDKIIYKASNRQQVTDLEELNKILNNTSNENKAIVTEYINKLYKKDPSEEIDEYWKQQTFDSKEVGKGSRKATLTRPGTSPNTFNEEELNNIRDPQGRRIIGKFYTAQGSEYIISEGGSTRRIKSFHFNTGGEDAGLHNWMKHAFFTKNERFGEAAYLFMDSGFDIAIMEEFGKAILRVKSKQNGDWYTATWKQVYPKAVEKGLIQDGEIIVDISHTPVIGYSLFEYEDDPGNNFTAKRVHPGSKVSYIDTMMKSYINDAEVRVERCKLRNKEDIINVTNTHDGLHVEINPKKVNISELDLSKDKNARVTIQQVHGRLRVVVLNTIESVFPTDDEEKTIIDKYIPKELQNYINNHEYNQEMKAEMELSNKMLKENPNVTINEIIKAQRKLPNKLRDKFGILTIDEYNLETNELENNEAAPSSFNKDELSENEVTKKLFGENQTYGALTDFITSNGNILEKIGGIEKSIEGNDRLNIPKTIVFYLASLRKITINEFKEKINQINTIEDISKIFNLDLNSLKILSKYLMETFKKENDSNIECIKFDI